MNRSILTTMALGAALLSSGASFAATPSIPTVPSTVSTQSKPVHFALRNDTAQTIKLQAGSQELVIQAGKTMSVKLPVGTNLVAEDTTPTRAAGTVLVQVAALLDDTTVVLK